MKLGRALDGPAHDVRSPWAAVEHLVLDCRYALRMLRRRPTYALLSILTLALGVGGVASVYGIARGVLFDPLPFAHEEEVGIFWKKTDWTHEEYLYIRGRVPGFREVALYRQRDVIAHGPEGPARLVRAVSGSGELFDVLGATPLLGRAFRVGEDVPGAEPVAVLSFGFWQELGSNPSIIGTRVTLDGERRTVVGVMPRGFWFPDPTVRLWLPEPLTAESRSWNSTLVGRVAPDRNLRSLQAPATELAAMLGERFEYPAQWDKRPNPHITPVRDDVVGPLRPPLLATLAALTLILLIGCGNVAALVLGQVDTRSTEFAVRSALGARRQRLAQQLILEVLLIALVAGPLGATLAWVSFTEVTGALPLGPWAEATSPDWRVFMSAMLIATVAAVLVALIPSIALLRGDLRPVLSRVSTRGIEGRGGRLENGLVIAQVALALMVATGAALLLRSVTNLYAVESGVRIGGGAVVDVVLRGGGNRAIRQQTLADLVTALQAIPGVHTAGAVQQLPLRGGGYRLGLSIPGRPDLKGLVTEYRIVTPGYLESIGIGVRAGRTISAVDRADVERVVVINEALAAKYFPGVDPIGKLISGDVGRPSRIIGIVADAAEARLIDAPQPVRYVPLAQMPWMDDAQSLVLRAARGFDETSLLEPARATIARVMPNAAVQQTTTMDRVLDTAVGPARQVVLLLSYMTALALLLGGIGVYGVIAHYASRRRRDWGIRVALGLPGSRVIAHVVSHGALLVGIGILLGIMGAVGLTRLLSSFLHGVSAIDPVAFGTAAVALLIVGVLAAFPPAWRAGRVNPLIALREQ